MLGKIIYRHGAASGSGVGLGGISLGVYFAPVGALCDLGRGFPRALPWAIAFRSFGACITSCGRAPTGRNATAQGSALGRRQSKRISPEEAECYSYLRTGARLIPPSHSLRAA